MAMTLVQDIAVEGREPQNLRIFFPTDVLLVNSSLPVYGVLVLVRRLLELNPVVYSQH